MGLSGSYYRFLERRWFKHRPALAAERQVYRAELMRDAEYRAAREHLIATTPERKRPDLLAFLDLMEIGGLHPVKMFGDWNERDPSERYDLAFIAAARRTAERRWARRQSDFKVNVAIGDSMEIGHGHVIRYADRLVNDTLVLRSDLTPEMLSAGIAFLRSLWNANDVIAAADAVIPIDPLEVKPVTPEHRRVFDDVIVNLRTNGVEIEVPTFGTLLGWTIRVSNPLADPTWRHCRRAGLRLPTGPADA